MDGLTRVVEAHTIGLNLADLTREISHTDQIEDIAPDLGLDVKGFERRMSIFVKNSIPIRVILDSCKNVVSCSRIGFMKLM